MFVGVLAKDDPLVDENRIRNLFKDTRLKPEKVLRQELCLS
jgi:hypothetical protein